MVDRKTRVTINVIMYSHRCLKSDCGKEYQDEDVDAYYCPECAAEKKKIAKTFDSKYNTVGQQPSSGYTAYMANAKTMKDQNGRSISFTKEKL